MRAEGEGTGERRCIPREAARVNRPGRLEVDKNISNLKGWIILGRAS